MIIRIIGAGMGSGQDLTLEARQALTSADQCFAMSRIAGCLEVPGLKEAALTSLPTLLRADEGVKAVLVSGDVGFYSAAGYLKRNLPEAVFEFYPGISSLAAFGARIGRSYESVYAGSLHGRDFNAAAAVSYHKEVFLLTGGKHKAQDILKELTEVGLGDAHVWAGEALSLKEERILEGTAETLQQEVFSDLTVLWIVNDRWTEPGRSLRDEAFIRGEVPMTKEEIRFLAAAYLDPGPADVLWDVGAGTGSVSMELAGRVPQGTVYAVEYKEKALDLIRENRQQLGRHNVTLVPGRAEAVLTQLPKPQGVFIGGSEGAMQTILETVFEKSPEAKVVITAVTLEHLEEARQCLSELGRSAELRQILALRQRPLGRYTAMEALSPVWLIMAGTEGEKDE